MDRFAGSFTPNLEDFWKEAKKHSQKSIYLGGHGLGRQRRLDRIQASAALKIFRKLFEEKYKERAPSLIASIVRNSNSLTRHMLWRFYEATLVLELNGDEVEHAPNGDGPENASIKLTEAQRENYRKLIDALVADVNFSVLTKDYLENNSEAKEALVNRIAVIRTEFTPDMNDEQRLGKILMVLAIVDGVKLHGNCDKDTLRRHVASLGVSFYQEKMIKKRDGELLNAYAHYGL